ncbi:hypothetical protein, partial [Mariniflexile rhizosphaerae]|uniref:hypothetical protein n=1 Tax=unclassified Mariniflexile TaxID=2643887 RepID=UPI00390C6D46
RLLLKFLTSECDDVFCASLTKSHNISEAQRSVYIPVVEYGFQKIGVAIMVLIYNNARMVV